MDFQACSIILLHPAHQTKCTTQVNRIETTRTQRIWDWVWFWDCGEQNDNLRSKTPPENSIQIFPSQFGSHSARVMMENRLRAREHTHAHTHTHRAVIIVGQPCLFAHTTPVHKYAHRHITKIIFLCCSIPKLVIEITQSIGGKHKHNNMYKRLTCIQ